MISMMYLITFTMITFFLVYCSCENPPAKGEKRFGIWRHLDRDEYMGVVVKFTPKDIVKHDTLWYQHQLRSHWRQPSEHYILELECYTYYLGVRDDGFANEIYRISMRSKIEGIEIENFGVTTCWPNNLRYTISRTKSGNGFFFIMTFRHKDGLCYQRRYVTLHEEFTAKLSRYEVAKMKCTKDLLQEVNEDEEQMLITDWSIAGVFEKNLSINDMRSSIKSIWLQKKCKGIEIECREHTTHADKSKVLVADIVTNKDRLLLDRVLVTSCKPYSLRTSFICRSHHCEGNLCHSNISFMKTDGKCVRRSYLSQKQEGKQNNLEYTSISKGPVRKWLCTRNMIIRANIQRAKKMIGVVKPTIKIGKPKVGADISE